MKKAVIIGINLFLVFTISLSVVSKETVTRKKTLELENMWVYKAKREINLLITEDIENDGKKEIIFLEENNIYVLDQKTGRLKYNYSTHQGGVESILVKDIDKDAISEIIGIINLYNNSYLVFSLDPINRTFKWNYLIANISDWSYIHHHISADDIDNDEVIELVIVVIVVTSSSSLILSINGENGTLEWRQTIEGFCKKLVLRDIDSDNFLEIILMQRHEHSLIFYSLNGRTGELLWKKILKGLVHYGGPLLILEDFNSDHVKDIAGIGYLINQRKLLIFSLDGKNGSLRWKLVIKGDSYRDFILSDINADGRLELIVVNETWYEYELPSFSIIYLDAKTGSLEEHYYIKGFYHEGSALGDMDADCVPEAIIVASNEIWEESIILYFDGKKHAIENIFVMNTTGISSPCLADVDNDNKLDVILWTVGSLQALDANLENVIWNYPIPGGILHIIIDDLDADRHLELIINAVIATEIPEFYKSRIYYFEIRNAGYRRYWSPAIKDQVQIDPDLDYLSTYSEKIVGSNPYNNDTDNDGISDGWEVYYSLNPLNPSDAVTDIDNDGLTNINEYYLRTNPLSNDTDGDGMPDGWEVQYGLDPLNASDGSLDYDMDGLANVYEFLRGTDPFDSDSDDDFWIDSIDFAPLNPLANNIVALTTILLMTISFTYLRKQFRSNS